MLDVSGRYCNGPGNDLSRNMSRCAQDQPETDAVWKFRHRAKALHAFGTCAVGNPAAKFCEEIHNQALAIILQLRSNRRNQMGQLPESRVMIVVFARLRKAQQWLYPWLYLSDGVHYSENSPPEPSLLTINPSQ